MDNIKFSVLICTLNREELLKKSVLSILNQTYKNYEIIIIDQSDVLNKEYDSKMNINYVHIDEIGLSNARNIGLKFAKGEYICLMDDDAEYKEDVLEKAAEYLSEFDVEVISGKIIDQITKLPALKGMKKYKITNVNIFNAFNYCMSPSMIIKKCILEENGFDSDFGVGKKFGAGEETDLVLNILNKQGKVIYNPKILVYHPYLKKENIPLEKVLNYNKGFGALFKKHTSCNKIMYVMFLYAILKNIVGFIINCLNYRKRRYYLNAIKGKLYGFRMY